MKALLSPIPAVALAILLSVGGAFVLFQRQTAAAIAAVVAHRAEQQEAATGVDQHVRVVRAGRREARPACERVVARHQLAERRHPRGGCIDVPTSRDEDIVGVLAVLVFLFDTFHFGHSFIRRFRAI
jgi:hypothetical protein